MKKHNYVIVILVLAIAIATIETTISTVSADTCIAQLTYPIIPVFYANSNVPLVVPVSASCTTYYNNQLYAIGNAYDATSGVALGSVSTFLTSVNQGTLFNGQLGFNLPPSTQGHSVQISVSIYNGQYGNLITSSSQTIQVGTGTQQFTTTTMTQPPAYPYPYPSPYQSPPYQNQRPVQTRPYQRESQNVNSSTIFGYAAIAAILAVAIIATTALVAYGRRQPDWPPTQSPRRR